MESDSAFILCLCIPCGNSFSVLPSSSFKVKYQSHSPPPQKKKNNKK